MFNQIIKVNSTGATGAKGYQIVPDIQGNVWCLCKDSKVLAYDDDFNRINKIKQSLVKKSFLPVLYQPSISQAIINCYK